MVAFAVAREYTFEGQRSFWWYHFDSDEIIWNLARNDFVTDKYEHGYFWEACVSVANKDVLDERTYFRFEYGINWVETKHMVHMM